MLNQHFKADFKRRFLVNMDFSAADFHPQLLNRTNGTKGSQTKCWKCLIWVDISKYADDVISRSSLSSDSPYQSRSLEQIWCWSSGKEDSSRIVSVVVINLLSNFLLHYVYCTGLIIIKLLNLKCSLFHRKARSNSI